jgi:hypothetical protein
VSLKSRIHEAQREAAKRMKREARRNASDKDGAAMSGSKDGIENEMKRATPTVEEIRVVLLRKSTNGKNTQ